MTNNTENKTELISHGIESLIERLKNDGVQAGKSEADSIIKQAQEEANRITNEAQNEATQLINQANKKIQQEKQAAIDALGLAARNMRLELRLQLINRFKEEVKRLVHKELKNETTVRQLILLLTLDTAEQLQKFKESEIEIQLPEKALDFDKIRNNPKLLENDPLKQLVQGATSQMLREGMNIKIDTEDKRDLGVKVRIVGENIEMDLSEEAISELLLKHLQPRFRALLEGLLQ